MKKIVISGVNLVDSGTLKVFKDCIDEFSSREDYEVICLVHSVSLFTEHNYPNTTYIEYPLIKASWLARLKFEYITCKTLSEEIKPNIWLAMHDITPNVLVDNLFVYCHNPAPFYKPTLLDFKFNKRAFAFTLFYKYLYKINILRNKAVIVQQSWISDFFSNELKASKVLVAKPVKQIDMVDTIPVVNSKEIKLFYPSLSRTFKNFELLLNAMDYLKNEHIDDYQKITLFLTIDENSGDYGKYLVNKYSKLENVKFIGMLTRDNVNKYYDGCDIVVFPSKLETWGLPISEAKAYKKPIILADLPYAHETLGNYSSACFVDVNDHVKLAITLSKILQGVDVFSSQKFTEREGVSYSWPQLADKIISLSAN